MELEREYETKKVVQNRVTKAGSPPDIDTDYNTSIVEDSIDHEKDIYGEDSVAKVGVFQTYKSRGAFSKIASIYSMPFAKSKEISSLVNAPIADLLDPDSEHYAEGADFRASISDDKWRDIVNSAGHLEGRISSTSIHPCGVIISSKPLAETIPLRYTKEGEAITQWTYPECESIGLIKIDFLKLDTVDLTQNTVRNVLKLGKEAPNIIELEQSGLDDKATYEMIGKGHTVGIFQLAGQGVQDLLRSMNPKSIHDIAATTALYRPGPMGMQSHTKYAERSSGRENAGVPIHPNFSGSPLEEILSATHNLIVYQEQIIEISNRIAGMTLQEGDKLRKAVGKKKIDIMMQMKEKFVSGSLENGYSEDAVELLWDTIVQFAQYGFNKSHSYSYAINAYVSAYLKAHYPVEFMAASIDLRIGEKGKLRELLKECKRMGISVGTIDVNKSEAYVSPDGSEDRVYDIYLGLTVIPGLSWTSASLIVEEREKNGSFQSLEDFIKRCVNAGVSKVNVFENIALGGGFDSFGVTRKSAIENVRYFINQTKTETRKGSDIFTVSQSNEKLKVDLNGEEFDFSEKLKKEADAIGMYLSAHPMDNVGRGSSSIHEIGSDQILNVKRQIKGVRIAGGFGFEKGNVHTNKKTGVKSYTATIDDGKGYIEARFSSDLARQFNLASVQKEVKTKYLNGANELTPERRKLIESSKNESREIPDANSLCSFVVDITPNGPGVQPSVVITDFAQITLDSQGRLPIRIRLDESIETERSRKVFEGMPKVLSNKFPGEYEIYSASYDFSNSHGLETNQVYKDAIVQMDKDLVSGDSSEEEETKEEAVYVNTLFGGKKEIAPKKSRKRTTAKASTSKREWPPQRTGTDKDYERTMDFNESIETLNYERSGFTTDKSESMIEYLNRFMGIEDYDLGFYREQE